MKVLDCVGKPMTNEELDRAALRIFKTKLRIKQKLGFKLGNVKLPKRFFQTPSMTGQLKEETAAAVIAAFEKRCEQLLAAD